MNGELPVPLAEMSDDQGECRSDQHTLHSIYNMITITDDNFPLHSMYIMITITNEEH